MCEFGEKTNRIAVWNSRKCEFGLRGERGRENSDDGDGDGRADGRRLGGLGGHGGCVECGG
jgi:hypothetical protein